MGVEIVKAFPPVAPTTEADVVALVDPRTGELLDPESCDVEQLGACREAIRIWEQLARQAKQQIDAAVIDRMRRRGEWTLRDGQYTLQASKAGGGVEYDGPALHAALSELVDDGVLDIDAVNNAVVTEVVYKPQAGALKKLAQMNPEAADVIAEHSQETPETRRVSVRRAGG
jgi:hypothetical protein